MEFIIVLYLVLMFIALYMFSFFILLTLKNHKRLFEYPEAKKIYSVSVITPVWNEEESVKETIEHVMELNYPKNKIEVIVVMMVQQIKQRKLLRVF